jgi:hypothetical protein
MDQAGLCKALALLNRSEAMVACAGSAAYAMATTVDPTHAFARSHMAGIWFELGEAYESLADRQTSPRTVREKHRATAREMYRRSLNTWSDLTARKLISPIDTSLLTLSSRAVARTEAGLAASAR